MKRPLALIVPTRNRPDNANRLFTRAYAYAKVMEYDDIYFILGKDEIYLDIYNAKLSENIYRFPDKGLVKALNWASSWLKDSYDCLAFMGDDHFPQTEGWDAKYINELYRLGDGFVYGNDLLQGEKIPTQIAMTSSIVETLGYFGPPCFTHLCVDLAWKDLGKAIHKISYMPEVIIEHLHPANGKAENDAGYRYVNSPEMVERDGLAYVRWHAEGFQNDVEKLRQGLRLER